MKINNCTVICFSPNGTTEKIAMEVASGASANKTIIDMTVFENRWEKRSFNEDDLVVFAFPVYGGRVPTASREIFKNTKGNNTPAILLTVYGNRSADNAPIELNTLCENAGFIPIAHGQFVAQHCMIEQIGTNRPTKDDLKQALNLGKEAAKKLLPAYSAKQAKRLYAKLEDLSRPPKPPFAPSTKENCVKCGLCEKKCPMKAIAPYDVSVIDPFRCTLCMRCIKQCPKSAKHIENDRLKDNLEVICALNLAPKSNNILI